MSDENNTQLAASYAEAAELDKRAGELLSGDSGAASAFDASSNALCDVWPRLRPIIESLSKLAFIPSNIRRALQLTILLVDRSCSSNS